MSELIDALAKKTPQAPGLSRHRATDLIFFLTGPEACRARVLTAGWSPQTRVRWASKPSAETSSATRQRTATTRPSRPPTPDKTRGARPPDPPNPSQPDLQMQMRHAPRLRPIEPHHRARLVEQVGGERHIALIGTTGSR